MAQLAGLLGQTSNLSLTAKDLSKSIKTAHLISYLENARIDTPTERKHKWQETENP
jgi:hypothetical protein